MYPQNAFFLHFFTKGEFIKISYQKLKYYVFEFMNFRRYIMDVNKKKN